MHVNVEPLQHGILPTTSSWQIHARTLRATMQQPSLLPAYLSANWPPVPSPFLPKGLSSTHFPALHSRGLFLPPLPWDEAPTWQEFSCSCPVPVIKPEHSLQKTQIWLCKSLTENSCMYPESFMIKFRLLSTYHKPEFHHSSTSVHCSP